MSEFFHPDFGAPPPAAAPSSSGTRTPTTPTTPSGFVHPEFAGLAEESAAPVEGGGEPAAAAPAAATAAAAAPAAADDADDGGAGGSGSGGGADSDADTAAKLAKAKAENRRLKAALDDRSRDLYQLREKLASVISGKKAQLAEQTRAAADDAVVKREASKSWKASRTAAGLPSLQVPMMSPRTKRLASAHLAGGKYGGNYGERLYTFGTREFHDKRDGRLKVVASEIDLVREKELTFLPAINNRAAVAGEEAVPFWDRLCTEIER